MPSQAQNGARGDILAKAEGRGGESGRTPCPTHPEGPLSSPERYHFRLVRSGVCAMMVFLLGAGRFDLDWLHRAQQTCRL